MKSRLQERQDSVFSRLTEYLIYFILIFAVGSVLFCLSGVKTFGLYAGVEYPYTLLVVLLAVLIGISLYFFAQRIVNVIGKYAVVTGLIVANLVMAYFLRTVNTLPVSDYENIYGMALSMADGNYDIDSQIPYGYGYIFNWQTGIGVVESILFRIFGPSLKVLKCFNWLLINVTLLLTYYLARKLTSLSGARFTYLLMCLYYPILVTVGQFSNQHVVAPLILVLIILVNGRNYLAAGFLIPVISFVRPLGAVLLTAVLVWLIYKACSSQVRIKEFVKEIGLFLLAFIITTMAIDTIVIQAGYAKDPVSQATIPYFKFYQGLTVNEWNNPAEKIGEFGGDVTKYNDWSKEQVKEAYLKTPGETALAHIKKMTMFLGMYDWKFAYSYNMIYPEFHSGKVIAGVGFGWAEYLILLLLCLWGYGRYRRKHGLDFLQVLFIGLVSVYIFIEAWPDYRFDFYTLMFIFAGCAIPMRMNGRNVGSANENED